MSDPERLRAQAVRLFALALEARGMNAEYADQLVARAIQLQDEAAASERAAPQPDAQQQADAPQRPVQPNENED